MKKAFKVAIVALICFAAIAVSILYIRTHEIAIFGGKGAIGEKEADLIITASLLMLIIVIPVLILTWVFAWRYREGSSAKHTPDWEHNAIAEYCWWGIPLFIIVILAVITWKSSHELNPFKPLESDQKPLVIQVVALEWKWLFLYPEQGIATVNYVQFPEKKPLNFEITADAPMNSFWIPQLGGQIYAMPAMRTKLHLMANGPGTFRGVSANLSGDGFAGMTFTAVAGSEEEFNSWVQSVRQGGKSLGLQEYRKLAQPSSYDPVSSYQLTKSDLFDAILMKYMRPE
jgi:cytochrome o ubiquinol oxidase subunit 2